MGKNGLVLGGGGSRGAYQIGMWKAMKDLGFDKEINMVSGTSVGALNAVLFALGDYQLAFDIWEKINAFDLLVPNITQTEGWFSRSGLINYINDLDFSKLKSSSVDVYITVKHIGDKNKYEKVVEIIERFISLLSTPLPFPKAVLLGSEVVGLANSRFFIILIKLISMICPPMYVSNTEIIRHFFTGDVEYYHINSMNVDDIKALMLASSAISFVYESVHFNGKRYIDAGGTDLGNNPIKPLYDNNCKNCILVPLDHRFNINKISRSNKINDYVDAEKLYPNIDFKVIKPSKNLGFILDFSKYRFKKNFNLGENDLHKEIFKPCYIIKK